MNISLINGGEIDSSAIVFDADTYHFSDGSGRDLTNEITQKDKMKIVPDFDQKKDTFRMSNERRPGSTQKSSGYGNEALPESTAGQFLNNIVTDPLSAPIESLGNKADQFFGTAGIWKMILFGLFILGLYVYVAGGWFRRKG